MTKPSLSDLLHAAVSAVGGTERPGQVTMAEAVAEAIDDGSHLLVQAGTGTGKSLGYLVPALAHGERVVVATATLALQRQLVERDLPRTVDALHPLLRRRPEFAMLKGRSNYLCLHRLHEGMPQDEEEGLFDQFEAAAPTSKLGQDLLRLRDWADETESGDRDDLTPGVSDRAWSQVSVSSRECLGASKCAYGAECFAEMARERAKLAEVVVTNHALLAIDAIEGAPVLPQHEVLIVDEAHELVSRVTGVATGELTPGQVNRAVRRAAKLVNEKAADQLQTAAEGFERLMELALPGRLEEIPEDLGYALMALRDAARTVISAIGATRDKSVQDEDAVRKQALASVETVHDVAERVLNGSEWGRRLVRAARPLRRVPPGRPPCPSPACSREALRRPDRRPHLGHAQARRRLQRRRSLPGARPRGRGGRGPAHLEGASTSARPSTTPGRASCTSPSTWRVPRATASAPTCWTS